MNDKEKYPGNSHKEEQEKRVEKVVQGEVRTQKPGVGRRIKNSFSSGDDAETVGSYLWYDILVPAAKELISDMVTGGVEMWLFGTTKGSRTKRQGGRSYVDYGRVSRTPAYRAEPPRRGTNYQAQRRAMHNFDDIVLSSRGEAEEVLSRLVDLVDMYGMASVADLYDLVGITSNYTDNNYGWTNLSRATVERIRGGYLLNLPRTILLD